MVPDETQIKIYEGGRLYGEKCECTEVFVAVLFLAFLVHESVEVQSEVSLLPRVITHETLGTLLLQVALADDGILVDTGHCVGSDKMSHTKSLRGV